MPEDARGCQSKPLTTKTRNQLPVCQFASCRLPVCQLPVAMDTPRKVGYGRGAGRLDTGAPVSSPVGRRPRLSADPVYDVPPVLAPGPLAAGPPVLAALYDDAERINAVAIKLPELWQSHVQSWFAQAEAQFATSGVSASLTRYYHVIKSLP